MYTPEELSTVPTADLVETLHRRCDSLVLIMSNPTRDGDGETRTFYSRGGYYTCIGLVELNSDM